VTQVRPSRPRNEVRPNLNNLLTLRADSDRTRLVDCTAPRPGTVRLRRRRRTVPEPSRCLLQRRRGRLPTAVVSAERRELLPPALVR